MVMFGSYGFRKSFYFVTTVSRYFHKVGTSKVPLEPVRGCIDKTKLPSPTKVDQDTIQLLERLSLVDFGNKEGIKVLEDAILFADKIQTVDTTDVEPLTTVLDMSVYLRDDEVTEGNCQKEILSYAEKSEEGYFVSPIGNIPLIPKGIPDE